jgi:hypothetical protein
MVRFTSKKNLFPKQTVYEIVRESLVQLRRAQMTILRDQYAIFLPDYQGRIQTLTHHHHHHNHHHHVHEGLGVFPVP